MEESHPDLYRYLERPASYPHRPSEVQHIQTHISHVYIAPPYVYKIKKPVDFGFLDYSSLEKRKHFCAREVELNRRLCSDIYLGIVAVTKTEDGYTLDPDAKGEVVEYAVKMNKLDERFFLHTYIENDSLEKQHLDRVADKLAAFYLRQDPDEEVLQYGDIGHILFNAEENFRQTEYFIGETIKEECMDAIRYFTGCYLEENEELFEQRVNEHRIVDGHGDLHLEHIHVRPDRLCIYDCIEFNERFRCGDQALDLAFLAMDLDFLDRWKEERYFVDMMAKKLDDPDLHKLLDFYKCYRAYVKGKVKSMQSMEDEVEREDRKHARRLAARYFDLSLRYALLGSRPRVLIFMGRVASGKSTLAEQLSDWLDIDRFSSDRIRKSIAGLPLHERPPASDRDKLYSSSMSDRTYRQLRDEAVRCIGQGESVILDATYSRLEDREELVDSLESEHVDYLFIEAVASDEVIRSRLIRREDEDEVVSDARIGDFETLNAGYESPDELDPDHLISVDTGRAVQKTIKSLCEKIIDRQFKRDG